MFCKDGCPACVLKDKKSPEKGGECHLNPLQYIGDNGDGDPCFAYSPIKDATKDWCFFGRQTMMAIKMAQQKIQGVQMAGVAPSIIRP